MKPQTLTIGLGVVLIALGAYFLRVEMAAAAVRTAHVYTFAGMIGLGALIIEPGPIASALASVRAFLPWVKP